MKKLLPRAPLSLIFKLLRKNGVKVDRKRQPQDYKLIEWEKIEIYLKEEEFEEFSHAKNTPIIDTSLTTSTKLDKKSILFEDEAILVINKNPGVSVHPWDHKSNEVSLIEQVHDYLGNSYNSLTFRPSLVHRIDRDTSGVILIAKTKPALDFLLKELQWDRMKKIYNTLVLSVPNPKRATIRKKLLRIEEAQGENKVKIDEIHGQSAVTHYETLQEFLGGKYSLLECQIETGRTHQIRVHLASIGCPIIGDKAYGNKSENSYLLRKYGVQRQFLHAISLEFTHPTTKKTLRIEAPFKEDMMDFIQKSK